MSYVGRKSGRAALIHADIPSNLNLLGSHVKIPTVTTANLPGAGDNASITPVDGMLVYNSTLGMLQQRAGGVWEGITTAPVITSFQYSDGASATAEKTVIVSLSCGTTNTSTTVTAASTTGIVVGQVVSGVGVPLGATVVSIITNTSFVLSSAATATATVTLTFGGVITITGTNFDSILAGGSANASVTFDGTSATSISVNSLKTIITCTPPAHAAGTITLLVTNASGLTASTDFVYDEEAIFTTAAGSLGGFVEGTTYVDENASAPRIEATEDSVALTTGFERVTSATDLTVITTTIGDLTLQTSGYLTGTLVAAANATTYPFYATAKDSQNQRTAPRLFNIISYDTAASGGDTDGATVGSHKVHVFLSGGTFTNHVALTYDILIVGGGGGGGGGGGAGGGAGGMLVLTSQSLTAGARTVVIGDGGDAGGTSSDGGQGDNSSFDGDIAYGGGFGSHNFQTGGDGGSGGGGRGNPTGTAATGVSGQGYAGGQGSTSPLGRGGGGGAGGVGGDTSSSSSGLGGLAATNDYRTGSAVYYAGGGGGGRDDRAPSGVVGGFGGGTTVTAQKGGGADGGNSSSITDAVANTGGGGGGGYRISSSGSAGGSGIVVIRYLA